MQAKISVVSLCMSRAKCSIFRSLILLTYLYFNVHNTRAQDLSVLSGKILDEVTREPVPFATVFLASTTYGAAADTAGVFKIEKIRPGKYDAIVSCVGYETASTSIDFTGKNLSYVFLMRPKALQLKEVVVTGGLDKKQYRTFLKYFLGLTPNANHCEISNPEEISLHYDQKKRELTAEAAAPLEIINKALGYKIYYLLDEFAYNDSLQFIRVFGIPRFEDLTPENERQRRQWIKARNTAYYGSLNHLMRSIHQRDSLLNSHTSDTIHITGRVTVEYYGEWEHPKFRQLFSRPQTSSRPMPIQTSFIKFDNPFIKIYENGYFEDLKSVTLDGYLGWSESIAEMVPFGYEPENE
jgi:hypothetical protein